MGLTAASDQHGHRQRLRTRFLKGKQAAVADYELLELLLFGAKPRGDVKPLAKALLKKFGTFKGVICASEAELLQVEGMGQASVVALKVAEVAAQKLLQEKAMQAPVINAWPQVLQYCRAKLSHLKHEEFHLLFLDRHNRLIADELQQSGTLDHAAIYPREVIRRALDVGAAALIMVHNHPSGDPKPSSADILSTRRVLNAAQAMGIKLYDHVIIGSNGRHSSLKEMKYI